MQRLARLAVLLLLVPFYVAGYVAGCVVWASLIVWAALVEAYLLGRGA
jgi:hypothetical protein